MARSISTPGTTYSDKKTLPETQGSGSSDGVSIVAAHDSRHENEERVGVNDESPDDISERRGQEEEEEEEGGIEDVVVKRKKGVPNIYSSVSPEELECEQNPEVCKQYINACTCSTELCYHRIILLTSMDQDLKM